MRKRVSISEDRLNKKIVEAVEIAFNKGLERISDDLNDLKVEVKKLTDKINTNEKNYDDLSSSLIKHFEKSSNEGNFSSSDMSFF